MTAPSHTADQLRPGLLFLGEFLFFVDVLVIGLVLGVVALGGIDPFKSTALTALIAATVLIAGVHHVWYRRHRREIEQSHEHLAARERRGF